jgi:hypothetical protein
MEEALAKIDGAINKKLGTLKSTISISELSELHSFLKEAKGLRDTLISMVNEEEDTEEYMEEVEGEFEFESHEAEDLFIDIFVESCHLIHSLYILIDDTKVKDTNSEWIFEESRTFIDKAREIVGARIPELPLIRVCSKSKTKK